MHRNAEWLRNGTTQNVIAHPKCRRNQRGAARSTLDDLAGDQMVCINHAMAVREHTASWLGVAVIGGIAINGFVCVKAVFITSQRLT